MIAKNDTFFMLNSGFGLTNQSTQPAYDLLLLFFTI